MSAISQVMLVVGLILSLVGIATEKDVLCHIPIGVILYLGAVLTVIGACTLIQGAQ